MLKRLTAAIAFSAFLITAAFAQDRFVTPNTAINATGYVLMCLNGSNQAVPCSNANPLPVNATVSATATIAAFAPSANFQKTPATSSARQQLTGTGTSVVVNNYGSNTVHIKFGDVTVTAATTDMRLLAGENFVFDAGANTYIAYITDTSTTTIEITQGTGLPAVSVAGSGGGGGGGAITAASGSFSSGALASGSVASGAFASGSIASGAFASGSIGSGAIAANAFASGAVPSGAYASGALADGSVVGIGALADTAWTTGNGSVIALLKATVGGITGSIPAGSAIIGKVTTDQTTPGTTDLVHAAQSGTWTVQPGNTPNTAPWLTKDSGTGATGSAVPTSAGYAGGQTSAGLTGNIACDSSIVYDASTNGSTQLVALSSGKVIYVCGYSIFSGGTVNVKLIYGTGTACVTSPSNVTPAYQLIAQTGIVDGAWGYRGMKTAASNELCINTSAGVAVQAIVYYTQF